MRIVRRLVSVKLFMCLLVVLPMTSKAGPIDPSSYTSVNSMYWTNHDLGIDIMRLSWADTLGGNTQASETDINNWLSANVSDGWNWANDSQFAAVYNWFDTDPTADHGWSTDQNLGSSLFMALNGTEGPQHAASNNNGYGTSGNYDWTILSKTESTVSGTFRVAYMSDFGSQSLGITCTNSYCDDGSDPRGYHDVDYAGVNLYYPGFYLGLNNFNGAALLVRDNTQTQGVPAPTSILFLVAGVLLLRFSGRKS
jgi:hypothetical protein